MPAYAFYLPATKERTATVVRDVEARTYAEVVVAVRRRSGDYRHADYLAGAILAFVALAAVLFSDKEFPVKSIPFDVVLAFALGAFVVSRSPTLRRLLSSATQRDARVRAGAREAFVDLNVDRTSRRSGVLVYASMLERDVRVLCDVGIPGATSDARFERTRERLADAVRKGDVDAFFAGIASLGDVLAEVLPCGADGHGANELPDAPTEAP